MLRSWAIKALRRVHRTALHRPPVDLFCELVGHADQAPVGVHLQESTEAIVIKCAQPAFLPPPPAALLPPLPGVALLSPALPHLPPPSLPRSLAARRGAPLATNSWSAAVHHRGGRGGGMHDLTHRRRLQVLLGVRQAVPQRRGAAHAHALHGPVKPVLPRPILPTFPSARGARTWVFTPALCVRCVRAKSPRRALEHLASAISSLLPQATARTRSSRPRPRRRRRRRGARRRRLRQSVPWPPRRSRCSPRRRRLASPVRTAAHRSLLLAWMCWRGWEGLRSAVSASIP